MQKKIEALIKEVSEELGLPVEVVKAVVESQFQCAREVTKEGVAGKPETFKNIRFRHLGLLVSRPRKILKIDENSRHNN